MATKICRIVVDTCIWLDFYLGSRPGHDDACSFIKEAVSKDVDLLCAITTVKDLSYLIPSQLKYDARAAGEQVTESMARTFGQIAWACIDNLAEIATPVALDVSDVEVARRLDRVHSDFEDNLVVAAALRAKASLIVTADASFVASSPVAALPPRKAIEAIRALSPDEGD